MKILLEKVKSQGFEISLIEYSNKGWIVIVTEPESDKEIKRIFIKI